MQNIATGCYIAETHRKLSPVGQRTRKQHCVLVATLLAKRILWQGGHPTQKHRTMWPFRHCTQKYRILPLGCNLAEKYRLTPSTHTRYSYHYTFFFFHTPCFKLRTSKYSLQIIPSGTCSEWFSFKSVTKSGTSVHNACCPHSISSHSTITQRPIQ